MGVTKHRSVVLQKVEEIQQEKADEFALGHTGRAYTASAKSNRRIVYSAVYLLAKLNSSPDKESFSTLIL